MKRIATLALTTLAIPVGIAAVGIALLGHEKMSERLVKIATRWSR